MTTPKETDILDGIVYKWEKKCYLSFPDTVFRRRRLLDANEKYYFNDCYWMILK